MRIWRSGGGFDLDIMRDGTFFRDLGPDHFARYDKTRAAMRLVRRIKDLMSVPISARITCAATSLMPGSDISRSAAAFCNDDPRASGTGGLAGGVRCDAGGHGGDRRLLEACLAHVGGAFPACSGIRRC